MSPSGLGRLQLSATGAGCAAARGPWWTAARGRRLAAALTAGVIAAFAFAPAPDTATAWAGAEEAPWRVGHTVERMVVRGSAEGERRPVGVHLWYPAEDTQAFHEAARTSYTSVLHGRPLGYSDPLSWRVAAELARERVPIVSTGPKFPVIVFSHGNTNEPIDHAHMLERIAAAGFVVAAPTHVNNSQDDVRIDHVNAQPGAEPIPCRDGRPGPCARRDVARSMEDRVRDIGQTLDELPGWLGHRADVSRAGVMGHSRGTVAALAAVGGSDDPCLSGCEAPRWGFGPVDGERPAARRRIKAVMGLAIAVRRFTIPADLADVEVPTLLLAGELDRRSPVTISQEAFATIGADDKELVVIEDATHRTFDSTYCAQAQAAGAIAQASAGARLDRFTLEGILINALSGRAVDYCGFRTFTEPVDIRPIVEQLTGFAVTPANVPVTGLDTDALKVLVSERAASFFGRVLRR